MAMRPALATAALLTGLVPVLWLNGCPDWLDAHAFQVLCPTKANLCDYGQVCCYSQSKMQGTCITPDQQCDMDTARLSCGGFEDCAPLGQICCAHWTTVDGGGSRHFDDVSCAPDCDASAPNTGWVCGNGTTAHCPEGLTATCTPIHELLPNGESGGYGLCAK
jgi:hypothetical protein